MDLEGCSETKPSSQHWLSGAESASGVKPGCACGAASGLPVWQSPEFPWFVVVCSYQRIRSCQGFGIEESTSLELGRGKGRVHGAQPPLAVLTVLRWMDVGCVVQVFQVRDKSYSCTEGTNPPRSAGAGGWQEKTGSEGQAAHLQVPGFFSCLLCNVELWTSAFPWRSRGALSLLSP